MSATGPAESCRCGCNVILMSQQRHGIWPLLICLPCLSGAAVAAPSREDRNSLQEGRPFASRLYRHKDEPPPAQPSTVSGIQLNSTEVSGSWNTQDSRDGRPRQSSSTGPSLSSKDAVSPGPRLQPWKAVCQPTLRRRPCCLLTSCNALSELVPCLVSHFARLQVREAENRHAHPVVLSW